MHVATTLVQAFRAVRRGERKLAALLVGAALIGYRFSGLGFVLQLAIEGYRRLR